RIDPSTWATAADLTKGEFASRALFVLPQGRGFEYVEEYPYKEEIKQAAQDANEKLTATPVTAGKYDLVLHPSHLWLTIHESVGHSTELDRALLWEADFAGTSFLTPDKTGKLQFGSKLCNFYADRTHSEGLATVGCDEEGVRGQRWPLVKDGLFVG